MEKFKDKYIEFSYLFTWFSMLWYRLTMRFSRKKGSSVKKFDSIEEIPKAFNFGKDYRSDMLFGSKSDHLTHPSKLQWNLDNEQEFGDCDDHAIYWCVSLLKSGLAKKVWFAFYSMKEVDEQNVVLDRSAHAVCVFCGLDDELYWCDYRNPRKMEKIEDFMHQSAGERNKQAVAGCIWLVNGLEKDDTPKFGKITRIKR